MADDTERLIRPFVVELPIWQRQTPVRYLDSKPLGDTRDDKRHGDSPDNYLEGLPYVTLMCHSWIRRDKPVMQRAELRVAVFDGDRYGLYWRATLRGYDLYHGAPPTGLGEMLRASHHASGQFHLHLTDRLVGQSQKAPLSNLQGSEKLGAVSHDSPSWGYQIKPDKTIRRTLILNLHELRDIPSFTVELWGIEQGRTDLLEQVLQEEYSPGGCVLGHIIADWTQPWLLALAWTLTQEGWVNLKRSVEADKN